MESRRTTLKDVARAAGVSPTTVSFVLNETPRQTIPDETRQRVRHAAVSLGYTPHGIARALREGSSRVVLLNTGPWRGGHSLESFINGLDAELQQHEHVLVVHYGHAGDGPISGLTEAIAPRIVLDLASIDLDPVASSGGWIDGIGPATTAQLKFLHERGHRHLAMTVPAGGAHAPLGRIRLAQAQRVAASLGISPLEAVVLDGSRTDARRALGELRLRHPQITAIAAFDDEVALLTLAALRDLDVQVPRQLAVIGLDDSAHGAFWSPTLTSVHIDAEAYGRRAARAALGLAVPEWIGDPATVIRRESA